MKNYFNQKITGSSSGIHLFFIANYDSPWSVYILSKAKIPSFQNIMSSDA